MQVGLAVGEATRAPSGTYVVYSQEVQPTTPTRADFSRPLQYDTDPCRLQSTAGRELQNRGPRVRILPPLPIWNAKSRQPCRGMGDCAANGYGNSLALCSHPASCRPEIPTSTMLPTSELRPCRVVPHFDGLPSAALNRATPGAIIQQQPAAIQRRRPITSPISINLPTRSGQSIPVRAGPENAPRRGNYDESGRRVIRRPDSICVKRFCSGYGSGVTWS
jgi:hypothetical protein